MRAPISKVLSLATAWLMLPAVLTGCGAGLTPEQTAAIVRVQELGGKVSFENGGYRVNLQSVFLENEDLSSLKDIPDLHAIDLRGAPITDEAVPHLQAITTLRALRVERTGMTAAGIEQLKAARPDLSVR